MRKLLALAALASGLAAAADAQAPYRAPRTWLGHPDLQGTWTNETKTRLERPVEMGDRLILTPLQDRAFRWRNPGGQLTEQDLAKTR